MKKNLLLFCGMASAMVSFGQTACSDLFYSMYVCGAGENKAVEIYNPTSAPIVLDNMYRVTAYMNGSTTASVSRNLMGTIGAYSTWVFSNGQTTTDSVLTATPHYATPPCDPALIQIANQLDTAHFFSFSYFNGDDALTLDKNMGTTANPAWVPIDIFACIGERPKSATGAYTGWWATAPYNNAPAGKAWTKAHSMVRKPGVKMGVSQNPNPGSWDPSAQWDSLPNSKTGVPPDYYPNPNSNSSNQNAHWCACNPNGIQQYNDVVHVNVFPNPAANGIVNVVSGKYIEMVQLYDLVGKEVYTEKFSNSSLWVTFNTASLPKGTYLLKTSCGDNIAHVSKVVVQ